MVCAANNENHYIITTFLTSLIIIITYVPSMWRHELVC